MAEKQTPPPLTITATEIQQARDRIRNWPRHQRVVLTDLTEQEVEAIMLLTALLDLRPTEPGQ